MGRGRGGEGEGREETGGDAVRYSDVMYIRVASRENSSLIWK